MFGLENFMRHLHYSNLDNDKKFQHLIANEKTMNLQRKHKSGQKSWKKLVGIHHGDQECEEEGMVISTEFS